MKQNKNYLVNFMKLSEFLQRQITVSFVYLLVDVTNKNSLNLFTLIPQSRKAPPGLLLTDPWK